MNKKLPFISEMALGLVLTLFVAFSYHKRSTVIETASLKTYDVFSKFRQLPQKPDDIQLVEIDENAVTQFGRWPWPRSVVAQLIDDVVGSGAKLVGLNVLFIEPASSDGAETVNDISQAYVKLLEEQRPLLKRKKVDTKPFEDFLTTTLEDAKVDLDSDAKLATSIDEAVNVVLPMYFQPGEALGNLDPLPDYFSKEKIKLAPTDTPNVPAGNFASLPLESFSKVALAIGHSNLMPDQDGTLRRIAPVMHYGVDYYPSFAMQLIREKLKVQRDGVSWKPGEGFAMANARVPVDEDGQTYLEFVGSAGTFKRYSAVDVLTGGIPEKALDNKIVLIGVTAPGTGPTYVTPSGEAFTGLEIWATHIENIMNQHFIQRPGWAPKAELFFILLAALVVIVVLPMLRAKFAIPIAALAFAGMMGSSAFLFVKQGLWFSPTYGAALLAIGFVIIVGKRLIFTEKGKERVEAEGVETNKMLGLSFQGQGMLDLAFEKFRRCPLDDAMKELLYNLGLDMERKRQFSKAAAVYEHIATVDAKYKDIGEKIELLKKAGEGAVFGSLGKKGSDATVVVQGLGQNTTLGRYEVMKELGRGAMGIVYLGKDPKINRQVAIKTLRFEEDMDETQTKSVKDRFFREAESAGNLTHPNIIRIFDAGEDQDVAYIAMELLDGADLKVNCEKANLLPIPRVLDIIAQVASGLDYAHAQGVVHRDIKPANIMMLKDGSLRITDFGIARIQATSKTATGAVLGTPAYMSPEQVNGKKVDGRADIFSLGVTLFEMLTGEKPFAADSIAALLYRIANVDHPDPREFNTKVPVGVLPIINKALAKDPDQRYQKAGEMADDIRNFLKTYSDNGTTAAAAVKTEPTPPPIVEPTSLVPEAPMPEAMAAAPTGEIPVDQSGFLSELEEAFHLSKTDAGNGGTAKPQDTLIETPQGAAGRDTVIMTPPDQIERTVVMEADAAKNIPISPQIETGYQPPIPKSLPESEKDQRKTG